MTALVVAGHHGLIARAVCRAARRSGWTADDLGDAPSATVARRMREQRPAWFVHTAGGPAEAHLIEASVEEAARAAEAVNARVLLMSSDVVFTGSRLGPYPTTARPDVTHPYGRAKAAAEQRVLARRGGLVIRTSLTVSRRLDGPQEQLVRDAITDGRTAFYVDEFRAPLDVDDLAAAAMELMVQCSSGVFHVVGPRLMSRYELAEVIALAIGAPPSLLRRATSDGTRPRSVQLQPSALRTVIGSIDRTWAGRGPD